MKILVVSQYFFPEEFKINDLVKGMIERGHEVTVLTGKPNYPKGEIYSGYRQWGVQKETLFGAKVIRVPLIPRKKGSSTWLILNYVSYVFFSCFYVLTHRFHPDKIFVWDTSPILQAYAGIIVKKKTKASLSMWVQDLWPESVTATKGYSNGTVVRILTKMVKGIYNNFDTLFIQSKAFESSIKEKGNFKAKYVYAPNWAEDQIVSCKPDKEKYENLMPNGFKVMFAGNIGAAQDFDNIIEAANMINDNNIQWVIVGDGRMRKEMEEKVKSRDLGNCFRFLGRYPFQEMPNFFVHADVMLVSLKDEYIFSLTIPSKTQAYMASGKPIATMINGIGNAVVEEARCGLTAKAADAKGLASIILEMSKKSPDELKHMGDNGKKYYHSNFEKEMVIDRIISSL